MLLLIEFVTVRDPANLGWVTQRSKELHFMLDLWLWNYVDHKIDWLNFSDKYVQSRSKRSISKFSMVQRNKQTGHLLVSDYHGPWTPATQESQVRWRLKIPSFFFCWQGEKSLRRVPRTRVRGRAPVPSTSPLIPS